MTEKKTDMGSRAQGNGSEYKSSGMKYFVRLEHRLQSIGTDISVAIELVVAVMVFFACVVAIISLFPHLIEFIENGGTGNGLIDFLEQVFSIVVGIEFLKMLCKPTSTNVLETIIFLVARHMILEHCTALEYLFYVICIAILVLVKKVVYMVYRKVPSDNEEL